MIRQVKYVTLLFIFFLNACATNSASHLYHEGHYLASVNQIVEKLEKSGHAPNQQEIKIINDSIHALEAKLQQSNMNHGQSIFALTNIAHLQSLLQKQSYASTFSTFLQNPLYQQPEFNNRIAQAYYELGMNRKITNIMDQRWRIAVLKKGLEYGDYRDMRAQLNRSETSYRQQVSQGQIPGKVRVAIRYLPEGNYASSFDSSIKRAFHQFFQNNHYVVSNLPYGSADLNIEVSYNINAVSRRIEAHSYYDSTPLYELYGRINADIRITAMSPFISTYRDQFKLRAVGQEFFYSQGYIDRLFAKLDNKIFDQLNSSLYRSLMPYIDYTDKSLRE